MGGTMATTTPGGYVTWPQLIAYVEGQTDPLEVHMTTHDNWHRDRLAAEVIAAKANRLAIWAVGIAAVSGIGGLIAQIVLHR